MKKFRKLTAEEIASLERQFCEAEDWQQVEVGDRFTTDHIFHTRFSGLVRLGAFDTEFVLSGGVVKHSGLKYATLHHVTLGDNCLVENVKNYIANYIIGEGTYIENVDTILVDEKSRFGNGVEVSVMNETGGREVVIHDQLSAHEAYLMALYRHRPVLISEMKRLILQYADTKASEVGIIGSHVTIVDSGYIRNVCIGDYAKIKGAGRLKNGSLNSNEAAPVHIGQGVVCDDFIVSSGSRVEDGTMLTRCFVGQACHLGHTYSASDSLFFSNCMEENGEACAIFAGPFTVTHHKSTLLIAGMFSFMNVGSGSNQSNHMYKLGPIHQGVMERGAKTASGSYILWPARIGAFSLVMGRHVHHPDTSDLPFSYLIEEQNTTYLAPGVNLRSVGTIRDAQKWPKRDHRTDPHHLDQINYNLLSPYTIQKMMNGRRILKELARVSGETSEIYSFQSAKIKNKALNKGILFYETAIQKFLGNSLIKRLENLEYTDDKALRAWLKPSCPVGSGEWVDLSGLIAPKSEVERLMQEIEQGKVTSVEQIYNRFVEMHQNYYTYEWTWAYEKIMEYYDLDPNTLTRQNVVDIVQRWQAAVVGLDRMVYEDARKEFSLSAMTGFGVDGSREVQIQDFEEVRGAFNSNPFVMAVLEHIRVKTELGNELIYRLTHVPQE